jgi:YidC/Oxa1 family membrane protein insertase
VDQRRLLIASAISLLLLFAYQEFVLSRYRRHEPAVPASSTSPAAPRETLPPITSELAAEPTSEASVTVETDLVQVSIAPAGARLGDIKLKAYRKAVGSDDPLDLVQRMPVLPATLQLGADTSDARLVYAPDRRQLVLQGSEAGDVVFRADAPSGLHIEKRYHFAADAYLIEVTTTVSGGTPGSTVGLVLTPLPVDAAGGAAKEVAAAFADGHLVEKPPALPQKEGKPQPVPFPNVSWAGFAGQYFMTAAMPKEGTTSAELSAADGIPVIRVEAPVVEGKAEFVIYAGPKDRETLSRSGHDLSGAIYFGWFWFVAIPLLRALRVLHNVTGNYGVAIIVLTALVKAVTAPLTQTTFRNMREMQKIQPQMAKLRERYKDDQMALQKEIMELYRRHRVNPFAGCLPMVLQLPIFVGLYNALSHAIELRHAPFALWINDLSAPDRLMIGGIGVPVLTLLMGASMFLQQWLTPAQGDPAQQRMMMFMPLVFTFMFINFPAGLVLYWLVNNVLTIGQQYLMMRSMK